MKAEVKDVTLDSENRCRLLSTSSDSSRIVLLVGASCVGKTTFCEYVRSLGFVVFTVGDYLMENYGKEFCSLPPETRLEKIGNGESIFHGVLPGLLAHANEKIVFVDSIKSKSDPEVISSIFPDSVVVTVRISADDRLRETRFAKRNRPGDEKTLEIKDQRLKTIGIDELFRAEAHEIENTGSLDDFKRDIDLFIEECLNE